MFTNQEVGTDNQFVPAGAGNRAASVAASRKNGHQASRASNAWRNNPELAKLYNEAADLWNSGCTYTEIAEKLGVERQYISGVLAKVRKVRKLRVGTRLAETNWNWDRIWALHESGMSQAAIAKELGLSGGCVYYAVNAMRERKAQCVS